LWTLRAVCGRFLSLIGKVSPFVCAIVVSAYHKWEANTTVCLRWDDAKPETEFDKCRFFVCVGWL
jgi:hypothetical protein